MAYKLQGEVSRYDAEGNPLEYDFTDTDIRKLANRAGYNGPAQFAASYLQGLRNYSGGMALHPNGQVERDPRVNSVLAAYGIDAPRLFQNEYENLASYDPEANAAAQRWADENADNRWVGDTLAALWTAGVGGMAAAAAAGGGGFVGGASGGELAGGAAGGELAGGGVAGGGISGTTAAGGGGSVGFFDDILSQYGEVGDAYDIAYGSPTDAAGNLTPGSDWMIGTPAGSDYLGYLKENLPNIPGGSQLLKSLFSQGDGGAFGKGGLFGGDFLSRSLALAPSLAAINYAKNQDPFDISRLESAYDQVDPQSLTREYDINTGLGRRDLKSSLDRRGVMGSSFANQDLYNYNTSRDLGRSSLLTSGASTQANIASQILNAEVKERELKNNLYGRALLALSGGLMPRGAF